MVEQELGTLHTFGERSSTNAIDGFFFFCEKNARDDKFMYALHILCFCDAFSICDSLTI